MNQETFDMIERLKKLGAVKVKVGDVEVEFEKRDDSNFDPLQMMEKASEDAKEQLMRHMSDEEKERLEKKLEDELKYGSA